MAPNSTTPECPPQAALLGKEALAARRTGAPEAGFTDDGFALGLTFLLKVRCPWHPRSGALTAGTACVHALRTGVVLGITRQQALACCSAPRRAGADVSVLSLGFGCGGTPGECACMQSLCVHESCRCSQVLGQEADFDALRWQDEAARHFAAARDAAVAAAAPPPSGLLGWLRGAPAPPAPPPPAPAPPPSLATVQALSAAGLTVGAAGEGFVGGCGPAGGLATPGADPQGAALLAARMGSYAAEFELQRRTMACARGVLHAMDDALLVGDAN